MSDAGFFPCDPRTGEVLAPDAAGIVAASIAVEYTAVESAYQAAVNDVRELDERRQSLRHALQKVLPVEGRADGGVAWVVLTPGKPGRRSVSAQGCDAYREQLLTLGLGRLEQTFRPPKISEVDAARAELTAAGVPVSVIAPTPEAHAPTVVIVAKASA